MRDLLSTLILQPRGSGLSLANKSGNNTRGRQTELLNVTNHTHTRMNSQSLKPSVECVRCTVTWNVVQRVSDHSR